MKRYSNGPLHPVFALAAIVSAAFLFLAAVPEAPAQQTFVKDISGVDVIFGVGGSITSPFDTSIVYYGNGIQGEYPFLFKMDQWGAIRWVTHFEAPNYYLSIADATISSNGTITIGCNRQGNSKPDGSLQATFDANGNLLHSHQYLLPSNSDIQSICRTSEGGYIITGTYGHNAFLSKTDSAGAVVWAKWIFFDGSPGSSVSSYPQVIECNDSTLLAAGSVSVIVNGTRRNMYSLVRLSRSGEILAHHEYMLNTRELPAAGLWQMSDGSFLSTIYSDPLASNIPFLILRFKDIDRIEHCTSINVLTDAIPTDLYQLDNGDLIGAAWPQSFNDSIAFLYHLDTSQTIREVTQIAQSPRFFAGVFNQVPGSIGSYYFAGSFLDGHLQVTTATSSLATCTGTSVLGSSSAVMLEDIDQGMSGQLLSIGDSAFTLFSNKGAATTSLICSRLQHTEKEVPPSPLLLYPNPVSERSVITVAIPNGMYGLYEISMRDLTGREVYHDRKELNGSKDALQLTTTGLASGPYIIEVADASSFAKAWRGKVVVE